MKKLLLIAAAVLTLGVLSSSRCTGPSKTGDGPVTPPVDSASTPAATDLIVMVYSNAYDGFLNVREQPDVKSPIIGKILNGPMGAVKMGEVGGWTIVKVGEKIGYASSRYLQTEPTREFTDKDMEKCLIGIWTCEVPHNTHVLMLFEGGIYTAGTALEGRLVCGEWSVKGKALTLKETHNHFGEGIQWNKSDSNTIVTVENGDKLVTEVGDWKRCRVLSEKAYNDKVDAGEPLGWQEVDEENLTLLYESTHLVVKGSYPSGE